MDRSTPTFGSLVHTYLPKLVQRHIRTHTAIGPYEEVCVRVSAYTSL